MRLGIGLVRKTWLMGALFLLACGGGAEETPTAITAPPTATPVTTPGEAVATPTPIVVAPTATPAPEEPRYGGILDMGEWPLRCCTGVFDRTVTKVGVVGASSALHEQWVNYLLFYDPYQEGFPLVGELAESWQYDATNTKLTFKLHPNVKWHDGRPFTSRDVVYTLELAAAPPTGYSSGLQSVLGPLLQSITATDDLTVVLELKQPSASLLSRLASGVSMLPAHLDLDTASKRAISTGPFKLKSVERDVSSEWERNPDYWDKDPQGRQLPYLDGLRWFQFFDLTLMLSAFRTGRVKHLNQAQTFATERALDLLRKEIPGVYLPRFISASWGPLFKNIPPFNNPKVREAIDLWVDRKLFADVAYAGNASFYDSGVVPAEIGGEWALPPQEIMNRPGYRQVDSTGKVVTTLEELQAKRSELKKDPRDRERAKQLLQEAGIKPGAVSPELLVVGFEAPRGGPVFSAEMKQLFGATWPQRTPPPGSTDVSQGRFTVYWANHVGYLIQDPSLSFSPWLSSNLNIRGAGWPSDDPFQAKIDQIFAEQESTVDPTKRRELVYEFQRTLLDWRARVIVTGTWGYSAYWPEVRGGTESITIHQPNVYRLHRLWLAK
jgi:peptide/nickel transport system substrate-binding protein